jgi:hypothetical protein
MKKRLVVAMLAISVMVTGCTSVPDLDDVHRDMEAEYMAGVLLKYDRNSEDVLDYDRSVLNPTPAPAATKKPTASKTPDTDDSTTGGTSATGEENVVNTVDADEIMSKSGITVRQQHYEVKKSYDSSYTTINARDGKTLVIIKFRVKNSSGSTKKVNMMNRQLQYSLEIDGTSMGSPLMTILDNDLQYMNTKLEGGKSKEALLIFEVDSSQKIKKAKLNITEGSNTAQMSLK